MVVSRSVEKGPVWLTVPFPPLVPTTRLASLFVFAGLISPPERFTSPVDAEVTSASGRIYVTTNEGCTCPDWQFRGQDTGESCRHMRAAREAANRLGLGVMFRAGPGWLPVSVEVPQPVLSADRT